MFKDQFEHFFALAFSHVFDISVPVNDEFGTKKIAKEPQQIQEKKQKPKHLQILSDQNENKAGG